MILFHNSLQINSLHTLWTSSFSSSLDTVLCSDIARWFVDKATNLNLLALQKNSQPVLFSFQSWNFANSFLCFLTAIFILSLLIPPYPPKRASLEGPASLSAYAHRIPYFKTKSSRVRVRLLSSQWPPSLNAYIHQNPALPLWHFVSPAASHVLWRWTRETWHHLELD